MADDSKQQAKCEQNASNLVWIDIETTGLDMDAHHIIEIAVLITDSELNVIAEGPELVIHLDDDKLSKMNEWCQQNHAKSGLTTKVKQSQIDMAAAEAQVLQFIKQYVPAKTSPLCGNSIHIDKKFIEKDMPKLAAFLHYRLIDVTTLKELCRRWYPVVLQQCPKKKKTHRAMSDIIESIDELKYYRSKIFVNLDK